MTTKINKEQGANGISIWLNVAGLRPCEASSLL